VLGVLSIGTSTLFDIGVYLIVVGLVLDILRTLGAEIDRQIDDAGEDAVPPDPAEPAGPSRPVRDPDLPADPAGATGPGRAEA
jgi:multicomponent Na+:H+ antiporter subunit A